MTNNCRTECADCEYNETCLLEDYQCSMLESSEKEKFNGFVLEQLSAAGFYLTDGFENKCFAAKGYGGVTISRTENATIGYKVELNLDPYECLPFNIVALREELVIGYDLIQKISVFEGALDY